MQVLLILILILIASNCIFLAVLISRRLVVKARHQKGAARYDSLRGVALQLISQGNADIDEISTRDIQLFSQILSHYSLNLSPGSKAHIVNFFEESGLVDAEIGRLQKRQMWKRARAAYLLGNMGSDRALWPLLEALSDRRSEVRACAVRSLGILRSPEAVKPIVDSLVTRKVAALTATQALIEIGDISLPELTRFTTDSDPDVRTYATRLIGILGNANYEDYAVTLLDDEVASVRANAAAALIRTGTDRSAPKLRAALHDSSALVRSQAAKALGGIGDPIAFDQLLSNCQRGGFSEAGNCARALVQIDPVKLKKMTSPSSGYAIQEALDLYELGPQL